LYAREELDQAMAAPAMARAFGPTPPIRAAPDDAPLTRAAMDHRY
jgi:hypothetical protein